MVELIVLAGAAFGLAYIVGYSKISLPVRLLIEPGLEATFGNLLRRWLLTLLECPACFGFWAGALYGYWRLAPVLLLGSRMESALMLGFFTCGTNCLLAKWAGMIIEEGDNGSERDSDAAK